MKNYLKILPFILILGSLSSCRNSNLKQPKLVGADSGYYQEQYRPQFHFSPESKWMNDPNGLVYFEGEYHLFYQYYPDSTVWGPMHWGHAVSTDLLHWKHLPIALYPDSLGYIFSGSAVADINNTSGFGTGNNPPLVAIFTYHNPVLEKSGSKVFQNQGIAFSLDKGRTWTKYSANPVLKNPGIRDFRDPKMFWNEKLQKWNLIMAVNDRVHIYSSANLKDWTFESEFGPGAGAHGGVWECPDLFPLRPDGAETSKWVMLVSINPGGPNSGSATQYFTGDFDGHRFIPDETEARWIDMGRDDYAGVTWSGIPEKDGRRIFIGWMSDWKYATVVPTTSWRSSNTIPRELTLINENGHYTLRSNPVRELSSILIASDTINLNPGIISGEKNVFSKSNLMQSKLLFDIDLSNSSADSIELVFENSMKEKLIIGYSTNLKQFYIDRDAAGNSNFSNEFKGVAIAPYSAGTHLKLLLLIDASSLELFVDDGRLVMTSLVFPAEKFMKLNMISKGGNASLTRAEFHGIESVW